MNGLSVPLTLPRLGRDFKGIKDVCDLPITVTLLPSFSHLPDVILFSLVDLNLAALNLLSVSKASLSFLVSSSFPNRYAMQLEILQNSGSGGKTIY